MTPAKPFQEATIKAVLEAFRSDRRYRRFLVADEVGLGKTVVAQQVVSSLMKRRRDPLVVFYLCSNLSIAAQNKRKLLEILPRDERRDATCHVDRLTLIASSDERPTHDRLHLYSLTPDTSIPLRKGKRRDGRQDERALLQALVERIMPGLLDGRRKLFQRSAYARWKDHLYWQRERARSGALTEAFRVSVREEFGLEAGRHILAEIERRDLDELEIIGHLRNALAASAIEQIKPDLVIYDEFQRFRDLLDTSGDSAADRVMARLRGDSGDSPPAILLLSATPYRLYARRAELAGGGGERHDFYELIEFLYGGTPLARERRAQCESAFDALEAQLRTRDLDGRAAVEARNRIEQLLRPIMARTERACHESGFEDFKTEAIPAALDGRDLATFTHLAESFDAVHRSSAVPYWTSIPLPMQTMGPRYRAWETATDREPGETPGITEAQRNAFEAPSVWPHPRLRALQNLLPASTGVQPWIAPSCPWWSLKGAWANEARQARKMLVFSRFRAVPPALSAALSLALEGEHVAREHLAYSDITKRRLLSVKEGRHALLAFWHPSPCLVRETDPLSAEVRSIGGCRQVVRQQVRALLDRLGVRVQASAPHLPLWKLLARLDRTTGDAEWVTHGWERIAAEDSGEDEAETGLGHLVSEWSEAGLHPLEVVRPAAVDALAAHALSAPGVVVGRALRRHWAGAVEWDGFLSTLGASWRGLRGYLDQRWFYAAFRRGREKFPEVIRRLILDGNLEAVLDEHLWITSRLRSMSEDEIADELSTGLRLRNGIFFLHQLGKKTGDTFSLRCHVAMPFTEVRVRPGDAPGTAEESGESPQEQRIRTDDLRRSFNSPFWPHVLATTSVGQEGLDFHAWCDTIVHWDLCRNPVDLEQREGRIQRFGGLAVRKAIAGTLGQAVWKHRASGESPWVAIERLASEQLADESGLMPWWVVPGGAIKRYVFDVPTSEQKHWLHWIREQRRLYRLALGLPNQEDLLEQLAERGQVGIDDVRRWAINLSPWFNPLREDGR